MRSAFSSSNKTRAFRALLILVSLVSVSLALATPSLAAGFGQGIADKPGRKLTEQQKQEQQERQQKRDETDRNYNATIKSLPDSKEKFDPWRGSR